MPNTNGQVEVIVGCMFSGKTSALFDRIARAETLDIRWRLLKHCIDDRYGTDTVTTHNGKRRHAVMVSSAAAVLRAAEGADLVAIDEGHFFDAALPAACRQLAANGTSVVVTALDLDTWGRPFELVTALREAADEITVFRAACARCDAPATRTQRLTPIIDGDMVGGPEAYEPRCESCFHAPPEPPPGQNVVPSPGHGVVPPPHRGFKTGSSVALP